MVREPPTGGLGAHRGEIAVGLRDGIKGGLGAVARVAEQPRVAVWSLTEVQQSPAVAVSSS